MLAHQKVPFFGSLQNTAPLRAKTCECAVLRFSAAIVCRWVQLSQPLQVIGGTGFKSLWMLLTQYKMGLYSA